MSAAFALMLPPARLDELLQGLPAAQRATLKWEAARIREVILQLVRAPPDDRALVRALHAHAQLSTRLVSDLISLVGDASGVLADARASMEKDFVELRAAFQGTEGFSAVEWTTLAVMNFNIAVFAVFDQLMARKGAEPLASIPDLSAMTAEALDLPALGVLRAELLVFAMVLAINGGAKAADLAEHAEWAYLETLFRKAGSAR